MAQINKSSEYFNTVLYTGDGNSTKSISGVGFQLDWNWTKCRSTAYNNIVMDSVRGFGTGKKLSPNATTEEGSATNVEDGGGYITTTSSDGYDLGTTDVANNVHFNKSGQTYASWNWLAGGTASSNTDGSITSTVSANTTSGFSIVSYTGNNTAGATVGHGLSQEPDVIIFKNRSDGTTSWCVYHSAKGTSGTGRLNTTNSFSDTAFITTTPSSSVFTLTNTAIVNGSGNNMIAYCFAEKKGFSKFGSYTGNGSSTDGTFIYTGFKPAFVMVKRTDAAEGWGMFDDKRDTYNPVMKRVEANDSAAERTDLIWYDFLSNGFKARQSYDLINASGGSYIYMAFAENPLVGTNNIPATAR